MNNTTPASKAYVFAVGNEDRGSSSVYETLNEDDPISIVVVELLKQGYPLECIRVVKDYNLEVITITFR